MIGVGVIGYGYWGPNLVRTFSKAQGSVVRHICDLSSERLERAKRRYPTAETTIDYREVLRNPSVDAVAVATLLSSHYSIALEALKAGKHVWLEKPLAATSDQACRLIEEANRRNRVLMVDHIYVYNNAVNIIRQLVQADDLGEVFYYDSVRVNLGMFHHDINVLWDLAVHDLSIMDHVLSQRPKAVSAHGISHYPGQPENTAYLTLFFDGNMIAHIHVNWLAPVKVRYTLLGGSRKMIVYDDLEPSEKVKVYDCGIMVKDDPESIHKALYNYRTGDMTAPRVEITEPLRVAVDHFLDCIVHSRQPITDGKAGLWLIQILEGATRSMNDKGRLIELNEEGGLHQTEDD